VFEPLVDRQNHELAGSREATGVEQARDLGQRSGIFGAVMGEYLFDTIGDGHFEIPFE
jgi:hypothetical protein